MNRFFLSPDCFQEEWIIFPPDIAHQIRHVLRMKTGQIVSVLDNAGWVYEVVLKNVTKEQVAGRIMERSLGETEPQVHLTLFLSLTQREKFEWALQKCTEVGVISFVPVITFRSLVRHKNKALEKYQRWMRIIQEAAEQSHRMRLPVLHEPVTLEEAVESAREKAMPSALLWEGALDLSLKQWLDRQLSFSEKKKIMELGIFVGPEGGFVEEEVEMAQEAGIQAVSLGKRILRMETAAIVGSAIVLNTFGELS